MIKGYKASYNEKCMNNFLFEVGKTYEFDGIPICCQQGFHFCEKSDNVFLHYPYNDDFVLFEINAIGDIDTFDDKSCTNKIEIVRIIPKEEYNDVFENRKFHENGKLSWRKYKSGSEEKFDERGEVIWCKDFFGREFARNNGIWKLVKDEKLDQN
jgi:hypothetical protein